MARRNEAEVVVSGRDRTRSMFASVNRSMGRFVGAAGVAGAAFALQRMTREGLKNVDMLAKQSQVLGTTTEAWAAFNLLAKKTGIENKNLEKSLINMTRVVAEAAEGTGLGVDALERLGLKAEDITNLPLEQKFRVIADATNNLNSQSEKVLTTYELFGGRGTQLLRTIEAGSAGFDEAAEKTEMFGTAMSRVDAREIEIANDSVTDLQESVDGLSASLARRFAPAITDSSQSMASFVSRINSEYLPAFSFLAEKLGLIEANARALTENEIQVRIQLEEEKIAEAQKTLESLITGKDVPLVLFSGQVSPEDFRSDTIAEKTAAEERLAQLKAELDRRNQFTLEADRKLREDRAAQEQEAKVKAAQEREQEQREAFADELELENEEIEKRIQAVSREFREKTRLMRIHFRERKRREKEETRAEEQSAQRTVALRQAVAQKSIQALVVLAGRSSGIAKALFVVEKGLAIGRTIVNTSAAAMKALAELGPIAGPPVAAAIKAQGAAEVGIIAATGISGLAGGGGGGGGVGGSLGGLPSTTPTAFDGENFDGGGTAVAQQGVTQLFFPNLFGITTEAVEQIADALRDATENRDVIVVANTGRNADQLSGANA